MSRILKSSLWKWIVVFILAYGLLWVATLRWGTHQVRKVQLEAMNIKEFGAAFTDVTNETHLSRARFPFFYCKTAAYAPLLVSVKHGVATGRKSGHGGEVLYLWLFGASFRVHEFTRWVS